MTRCRLCTSNDHDALVEEVAKEMWLTHETSNADDEWRPWEEAGLYWQTIMRRFAAATLKVLGPSHS